MLNLQIPRCSLCSFQMSGDTPEHEMRLKRYLERLVKEHSVLESASMSDVPSEKAICRLNELSAPVKLVSLYQPINFKAFA